jgi:type I restriction enzyme S subunit
MSKQYICDLCKKVFNQKIDFTRHQNKKAPCITLTEMQQIIQTTEEKVDSKNLLTQTFKSCLNIMRDNEGLTGEKALRNLSYLLVLKLIEPHIGKEINFENYEYDFENEFDDIDESRKILLDVVYFKNLYEYTQKKEDNIQTIMGFLWKIILSKHPTTKNIFLEGKKFDIQHKSTFKKLIEKLNSLDLSKTEYDILGNAYEEVIKDVMTGKVLGQFFTQPLVKKIMVRLINPQIFPDGKIESCCDPTMGTGGFLITYLQYILQQARTKKINPDWDFIKNEGIYGKELEPDTYQLAISNMLISSGHMFEKLDRGDSIREPIERKFDNILANPPFGIKGLKYDDFESSLKNQYVPIKSDNAVSLFIQAIIYMLKINGKCAIVLPDGQDLFSKTNTTLVSIREYLMKTCDLKEIIYLPAGIFENTNIKTCIFYFVKKMEGSEILEIKEKTKSKKDYVFSKTHQTSKVRFYDYNESKDEKFLLVEVPIEKLISNSYSLNYAEYMKDETEEEQYEEGVVVKKLDQIFHITKGALQSSKNTEGEYAFITASDTNKTHNSFTHDCECVMLVGGAEGSLAKAQYFKGKFIASDLLYVLISKNQNEINYRYVWYYLNFNREKHLLDNKICCGTPKKMISKDRCSNIKIPIPSLERQEEIVKYLDFIYEKANKTSNEKISELKKLNEFCLNNQKIFGENVVKTLGEVCNFKNGKGIKKDTLIEGEYPVIGGGQKPMGFHNEYNNYENTILCSSSGAYAGFISKYDKKVWASDCFSIILKDNLINNNYLYYLLKIMQDKIYKLQTGTAQPHVYSKDLQDFKIPIPLLQRQKEIVEYCEFNDKLIKQLEKEIENNKCFAQKFITGIVKSQVHNIEEESSENIDENIDEINDGTEFIEDEVIDEEVIDEPKQIIKKILIKIKKN